MARPSIACPHCKAEVCNLEGKRPASFPFCSKRCRMVDLGKWLDESYSLSAPLAPEDEQALFDAVEQGQAPNWLGGPQVGEA